MTTKQIEEVFLTEDIDIEKVDLFDEQFSELKSDQTEHLQEALNSLS